METSPASADPSRTKPATRTWVRRHGLSKVDGRSRLGRFVRDTRADLTAQLGGSPTAAQRLLIQTVAIKAARLFQLEADLIEGAPTPGPEDYQRLAWLNSLSKDLVELGLMPVKEGKGYRTPGKRGDAGSPTPVRDGGSLADYVAQRGSVAA